jgi:4-hydroxy-2-oxoheptanedioate aldolase
MRRSRVLQKLRAGEVVSSFKINLACARTAEIVAMHGFDCIWTDREHTANDWDVIERQVWATKAHDADLMVRVSRGSYSDYVRAFEVDAAGIMVPHVMSLEDARTVVRTTRFHPIGRRALDGGNADGGYAEVETRQYIREANTERFVAIQIEDPEPLAELDAIAALDGIDMLFFGPGDFSQGIGVPGEWDHPEISRVCALIPQVCAAHGKFAGTVGDTASLNRLIDMGYRFINVGADVVGLSSYCRGIVEAFRRAPETARGVTRGVVQ